jgi:hypothetical protein
MKEPKKSETRGSFGALPPDGKLYYGIRVEVTDDSVRVSISEGRSSEGELRGKIQ